MLADYIVFDEEKVSTLPAHLYWVDASILPCAGVTAWSALKDIGIGKAVLIQVTGGVTMVALKLAPAAGLKVILSSSSNSKLKTIADRYTSPQFLTVNYKENTNWHEDILKITDWVGVDLVIEVGGNQTLVESIKCIRRGGVISQVGYLSGKDPSPIAELLPIIINRRVSLRGINVESKFGQDDLYAAVSAAQIRFDGSIDSVGPFEEAEKALEYI